MPFDWREYLDLAKYLNGGGGSFTQEAALRTVVSRAYYAAFCHARNYAAANQHFVALGSARDHARLRNHFRNLRDHATASQLGNLRHWRNLCDYQNDVPGLRGMVGGALLAAQRVISRF